MLVIFNRYPQSAIDAYRYAGVEPVHVTTRGQLEDAGYLVDECDQQLLKITPMTSAGRRAGTCEPH
jgi:hypothetical protein